jgi:hypothetical protein
LRERRKFEKTILKKKYCRNAMTSSATGEPSSVSNPPNPSKNEGTDAKRERLSKALRDNLARRKAARRPAPLKP